jgi:hypothetical protein
MYRIVEVKQAAADALEHLREIASYDSAYRAVNAMKAAWSRDPVRVANWHLLDHNDQVLFGPDDLLDDHTFAYPRARALLGTG